mmetsp:Transcript_10811/g.14131  ORF Transcript_10811/g.14131 Transcript_10811/m.14131 type:complete len:95 (-) Transcript_10811:1421-1705(-)
MYWLVLVEKNPIIHSASFVHKRSTRTRNEMRESGDKDDGVLMRESILGMGSRLLLGLHCCIVTLESSNESDSCIVLTCVLVPMYGKRVVGLPSE